jgi:glutathione S-transferase
MTILLHELALDRGILSSPYCWMVRFALAHKGLDYETATTSFTGIPAIAGGGQKMVPVLEDGGKIVADSWAIAEHLESAYPDRPSLFGGAQGKNYARFVLATFGATVMRPAMRVVMNEVFKKVQPQDRAYYQESRSGRIGMSIEEFTSAPIAERLAAFRAALEPVRAVVKDQKFLAGNAPMYADYIAAGILLWARAASPEQVLAKDDPIVPWFERMLSLYPRIAKDSTRSWDGP